MGSFEFALMYFHRGNSLRPELAQVRKIEYFTPTLSERILETSLEGLWCLVLRLIVNKIHLLKLHHRKKFLKHFLKFISQERQIVEF